MRKKSRPWFMLLLALTSRLLQHSLPCDTSGSEPLPSWPPSPDEPTSYCPLGVFPLERFSPSETSKLSAGPVMQCRAATSDRSRMRWAGGCITPVAENEPLLEAKVSTKDAGGGLPIIIRDGMRAVSVKVDEVIGVAGFVLPGTRVDVMLTLDKRDDRPQAITKTLLRRTSDARRGPVGYPRQGGKTADGHGDSLLVTPTMPNCLPLASKEGRLQLALRNTLDTLAVADQRHPG